MTTSDLGFYVTGGTLRPDDPSYVDMAVKFFEQFIWISSAMIHIGGDGDMWDEEDGFFYDVLRAPDGDAQKLKVRSVVGLLPLCAATVFSEDTLEKLPELQRSTGWFVSLRWVIVPAYVPAHKRRWSKKCHSSASPRPAVPACRKACCR